MGPALALKGVLGGAFSVTVFGIAQVAMDIEPLVQMIRREDILHGWTHTYIGATVIGAMVFAAAPAFCSGLLRYWNRQLAQHRLDWLRSSVAIGRLPAATGAFIGTFSHVALDSIMHTDMQPFAPFATTNRSLYAISITGLHEICVAAGLAGIALWVWKSWRDRQSSP